MTSTPIAVKPQTSLPTDCIPAPDNEPNRLRVLHVVNGEHYSGAERVQDLLALRLPEFGCEVAFACVKPDRFPAARESQQAALWEYPMRRRFDLRVVRRLAKKVREENFDLLHAHTPRSLFVASLAATLTRTPLIYHVHSPTSRDSTRQVFNWFNSQLEGANLHLVKKMITVSPSLADDLVSRGVARNRITTVPNGVPSQGVIAPRPTPTSDWALGMVALFRPRKGLEVLIDSLYRLRRKNVPVKLKAIGPFESARYEQEIRQQVKRLGIEDAVEWTGFTKDIPAELAKLDLFVLPSLFGEGLPMVVLEAMAAGLPVVASDVEGIPLAIRNHREGVIVPPNNVDRLAAGIEQIVCGQLNWQDLRRRAYVRHAERFSDLAMAQGVADVYAAAVASPRPR